MSEIRAIIIQPRIQLVVVGIPGIQGTGGINLGETSTTGYRGDRGKVAYDHSQVSHAPANADNTALNETSHIGLLNEASHDLLDHTGLTGIPTTLPASDVYPWAKATVKPTYTASEVGAAPELTADQNYISDAQLAALHGVNDSNTSSTPIAHATESVATVHGGLLQIGTTATTAMAGNTPIPSITGLLNETSHDALDHTGLTGIPTTLPASDVSAWAKEAVKPTYTAAEVGFIDYYLDTNDHCPGDPTVWNATVGANFVDAAELALVNPASNQLYGVGGGAFPATDYTSWVWYESPTRYIEYPTQPTKRPYIAGSNHESRIICRGDVPAFIQLPTNPGMQLSIENFVDSVAYDAAVKTYEYWYTIGGAEWIQFVDELDYASSTLKYSTKPFAVECLEVALTLSLDYQVVVDTSTATAQANITAIVSCVWLSRCTVQSNLPFGLGQGHIVDSMWHSGYEFYGKRWTPFSGQALITGELCPNSDGWGNNAEPNSFGAMQRFTLSETQYIELDSRIGHTQTLSVAAGATYISGVNPITAIPLMNQSVFLNANFANIATSYIQLVDDYAIGARVRFVDLSTGSQLILLPSGHSILDATEAVDYNQFGIHSIAGQYYVRTRDYNYGDTVEFQYVGAGIWRVQFFDFAAYTNGAIPASRIDFTGVGATGTFISQDSKTITVTNGLITGIV